MYMLKNFKNICRNSNLKLLTNVKCACYSNVNVGIKLQSRQFSSLNNISFFKLLHLKKSITLKKNNIYIYIGHPQSEKILGYWLLTCSGLVFGAVALGGITRLTESGLSMVTWRFFGEKAPVSEEQWLEEFEKYKQYPEFKIKNKEITLEDFKWIWRMEYIHRMWGRCIGFVFFVPTLFFVHKNLIPKKLFPKLRFMGILILLQGLMGWYMVKSGLEERFDGPNDVPRVSQYRLAAHLTLAIILYASFLRAGLELLSPALHWPVMNKSIVPFKILAHSSKGFVYLTAISGAFVAGLDAGLIYNSFPKMADKWIPDEIFDLSPFFKNFTENPTTVQFNHRVLGTTTLSFVSALWLWSIKFKLPPGARFATNAFGLMAYIQVGLGITTLLTYVPVYFGAMHQCGSLVLLGLATWLTHELKYVKKVVK